MMHRIIDFFGNKKTIVAVFLLILVILSIVFWSLKKEVTSQTLARLSDQLTISLNNQLQEERETALRYALMLSQNDALSNALEQEDEDKGFDILSEGMKSIQTHTNALIRSQIITSDYVIFARSWDNSYAGMPLDFHRPDLLYFQTHKNPRSAIEVGRKLGIKATVPIYNQDKMLGFVEVLSFFEPTKEYFDHLGIDLYILMDKQFYEVAVFMQENPMIGKKYILANSKYTQNDIKLLNGINYQALKDAHVLLHKGKYFFYQPMKNGGGEIIGAFVFSLTQKQMSNYEHSQQEDISFLIPLSRDQLYDTMAKESLKNTVFQTIQDKELLYMKDVAAPEDREFYLEEARERLNAYSKEELIGIMLNYKVSKKIEGEIR
ncbi:MAG: cache domain-containing protein [Sulfuricurvum sp.]|nr:cache domain-containing protein [Sulfuricurvum sp.]